MKILITSGGTKVPIDDVRFIGNMSSGRYGSEIQTAFMNKGDEVTFFHEKNSIKSNCFIVDHEYKPISPPTIVFKDYFGYLKVVDLVKKNQYDIIISAAAVSDYIVDKTEGKISSDNDELVIKLKKAQKILPLLKQASPKSLVVGFKLLVSPSYHEVYSAVQKVMNNGADLVVYNDLTEIRKGNNWRLLFYKDMTYRYISDVENLVKEIKNEHFIRSNG